MTSPADVERRLHGSNITAAQICHAGQTIIEIGDVSRPIDVHSIRKSIVSVLDNGVWNGRQLLSPEWVARSTSAISRTNHPAGLLGMYGYCW